MFLSVFWNTGAPPMEVDWSIQDVTGISGKTQVRHEKNPPTFLYTGW